jgi:molybdate transport system substrate-binding protein
MLTRCLAVAVLIASVLLLQAPLSRAQASLRVLSSSGLESVLHDILPEVEQAAGRKLAVEFGTSVGLGRKIAAGEPFDLAILAEERIDDAIRSGAIAAQSRVMIARSGIAVGVRSGARKPDISTPEALKAALLQAKSITTPQEGAIRPYLTKMFQELGIADRLQDRIILEQGAPQAVARVARGDAEIVILLLSEIIHANGIEVAGSFPPSLQSYVNFAAGISAQSGKEETQAAKAVISALKTGKASKVFREMGLEPL